MLTTADSRTTRTPVSSDDDFFAAWRARELTRVDRAGLAYVDYTGAALYAESLVRADAARLGQVVLGNPHSQHGPSRESTGDVERAREAILAFLHADPAEYAVVLTANATAACRLVGESFPFTPDSALVLTADNHNSVNGIREYARARGAAISVIPIDEELRLVDPLTALATPARGPSLFAFPAQSNFSGVRHPLALVAEAQTRGYAVLLDAASYVPTVEMRLDQVHPDFVALSVYKIAGYPSGVGALVARHESLARLQRPSFTGGTVDWVSVQHARHQLVRGPGAFEDGTVPFLAVGAVPDALAVVNEVGRDRLARHTAQLTAELLRGLTSLHHRSGEPIAMIHGPTNTESRGAAVALSVLAPNGASVPYWEVEERARGRQIALRGGCFCNPGCAERAFGFAARDTVQCLDELGDDFTVPRFAACLGEGTVGAIRISFGLGSVSVDVERVVEFIGGYAA
jgi:selenocysteine lyase/cysteine desulfurase